MYAHLRRKIIPTCIFNYLLNFYAFTTRVNRQKIYTGKRSIYVIILVTSNESKISTQYLMHNIKVKISQKQLITELNHFRTAWAFSRRGCRG